MCSFILFSSIIPHYIVYFVIHSIILSFTTPNHCRSTLKSSVGRSLTCSFVGSVKVYCSIYIIWKLTARRTNILFPFKSKKLQWKWRDREIYEKLVENAEAKQMVNEQNRTEKQENNASYVFVEYKLNNNIFRLFRRQCLHWNSFRFQCLRIDLARDQFFFLSLLYALRLNEWTTQCERCMCMSIIR